MARIKINRAGVSALLTSPEMRRALERAANDVAQRVRAAGSQTYPTLDVSVQSVPNGGVRGDRAAAFVIIAPPPPEQVRFPDRDRFDVLTRIAREVSR